MHVREIAAPAAGHENFFADLVGAFQHNHTPPALTRRDGAHQPGGTATDDNDIEVIHRSKAAPLAKTRMLRQCEH
jgi:hypothetical protein